MTFNEEDEMGAATSTRKRLMGLGAAFLLTLALPGCSVVYVCPAMAWSNTVEVKLEGQTEDVSVVELCADGVCSVPAPVLQQSDDPVGLETLDPQQLETFTPEPSVTRIPYFATKIDDSTWNISMEMAAPDKAVLRALSESGEVLAERDVSLNWVRVGGTQRCGGPAEAGPISLTIPA
ncbi:hypothetical protein [Cryobacterium shii]|uniref:Uncharacterized protein n=1 Tax=Cryobacterium shii TaxID=1259235 RepID=A0AAQ2C6J8_9MICO|nr:hypothetical protein [Cryobacterium shii]TFC47507.1 hypothetical protein E3O49_08090 [Cryobacterium shii]